MATLIVGLAGRLVGQDTVGVPPPAPPAWDPVFQLESGLYQQDIVQDSLFESYPTALNAVAIDSYTLVSAYVDYAQAEVIEESFSQFIIEGDAPPVETDVPQSLVTEELVGLETEESSYSYLFEDAVSEFAVLTLELPDLEEPRLTEESYVSALVEDAQQVVEEVFNGIVSEDYSSEATEESIVTFYFEDVEVTQEEIIVGVVSDDYQAADTEESSVTFFFDEEVVQEEYYATFVSEEVAVSSEIEESSASFVFDDAAPIEEPIFQAFYGEEPEQIQDLPESAISYYFEDAPVIVSTMRVWIGRGSVLGQGTRVFIKG